MAQWTAIMPQWTGYFYSKCFVDYRLFEEIRRVLCCNAVRVAIVCDKIWNRRNIVQAKLRKYSQRFHCIHAVDAMTTASVYHTKLYVVIRNQELLTSDPISLYDVMFNIRWRHQRQIYSFEYFYLAKCFELVPKKRAKYDIHVHYVTNKKQTDFVNWLKNFILKRAFYAYKQWFQELPESRLMI